MVSFAKFICDSQVIRLFGRLDYDANSDDQSRPDNRIEFQANAGLDFFFLIVVENEYIYIYTYIIYLHTRNKIKTKLTHWYISS